MPYGRRQKTFESLAKAAVVIFRNEKRQTHQRRSYHRLLVHQGKNVLKLYSGRNGGIFIYDIADPLGMAQGCHDARSHHRAGFQFIRHMIGVVGVEVGLEGYCNVAWHDLLYYKKTLRVFVGKIFHFL